jgi:hypothetical protein
VDLNADNLAVCVLDHSGNPVGDPTQLTYSLTGCRRRSETGVCEQRSPSC